jgi:glycosyltransferase involved in cell wall biosynthesis
MTDPLLFSIIVPSYNRSEYIGKTLLSVLSQSYPHFEVIVIDDGSTDNTREIVEKMGAAQVHYLYQENGERGKARNTGMKQAKGDYITFLDSDDLLYPNHLQLAAEHLEKFSFPYVYRQNYELRTPKGKLQHRPEMMHKDPNFEILKGNFFSCIGVFVHRDVTQQNLFCEDRRLSYTEDWEYWLRLSVRYKFYNCNTITSCMIDHSERSSRQYDRQKMRLLSSLLLMNLRRDRLFFLTRYHYLAQIKANMLSLSALMKVGTGQNMGAFHYLFRAIELSPRELIRKRSFAILKHSILNLF